MSIDSWIAWGLILSLAFLSLKFVAIIILARIKRAKDQKEPNRKEENVPKLDLACPEDILQKLLNMGYLNYVSPCCQTDAEKMLYHTISDHRYVGICSDTYDQNACKDFRYYAVDAEYLAEGGMVDMLKEMEFTLNQEGVYFELIEDEFAEGKYHLVVDGKKYCIGNEECLGKEPEIAFKRFLELVNHWLAEANSKVRLYRIVTGTGVLFLTPEMCEYICSLQKELKEWPDIWNTAYVPSV